MSGVTYCCRFKQWTGLKGLLGDSNKTKPEGESELDNVPLEDKMKKLPEKV